MGHPRISVFTDFDGTVTLSDTTDVILEALADPEWRSIESEWEQGKISSRECMGRQIPLIRGGWPAVADLLRFVKIDPAFASFAQWCQDNDIPVTIVSEGCDRVIEWLLERDGIQVDAIWSNRLLEGKESLFLDFSAAPLYGRCQASVCKCGILEHLAPESLKVVIGDGRSDFCWARKADVLFAKAKLLAHCEAERHPCVPFTDFAQVKALLETLHSSRSGNAVKENARERNRLI